MEAPGRRLRAWLGRRLAPREAEPEEALRREREVRRAWEVRYRHLAHELPLGVLVCDAEGRVVAANARLARLLGAPELLASEGRELGEVAILCRTGLAGRFRRCLAEGAARVEEHVLDPPAQGGRLEVRIRLDPLRDAEGRPLGVQGIVEDLRAERRLEAVHAVETAGAAAGGLAHDFRNLLGTILLHADLLEPACSDEAQRERLARMRQAALHARDLLERLLDPEARRAPAECDLREVVLDVAQLLGGGLPGRIELDLDLDPELPPVAMPAGELRQVALNLMWNAAEAMEERGGRLRVSARRERVAPGALAQSVLPSQLEGPAAVLRVADEGPGLPRDPAELFMPFFSTRAGGSGLGLMTVAHLARAHGAAVDVVSAPGRGTCFSVYLPPRRGGAAAPEASGGVARGGCAVADAAIHSRP